MMCVDQVKLVGITTNSKYWIDHIIAEAEEHPDEVEIILLPEQNDGSIKARLPLKYLEQHDQIQV